MVYYCKLARYSTLPNQIPKMYFTLVNQTSRLLALKTVQPLAEFQIQSFAIPMRVHSSVSKSRILTGTRNDAPGLGFGSRSILTKIGGTSPEDANANLIDNQQAQALAIRLSSEDRKILITALQDVEAKRIRDDYEGQLAAHRWRSKFGRPSKVPKLGDVDPTGTYCAVPDDWLNKKYAARIPGPSTRDLFHLAVANSIPFIGFGFLDNFIMIVAGDYIDHMVGSYICMSTMAAAALGNTFSDVAGIGSAFYVERFAEKIGFQPPKLSPVQLDMKSSRRASNLGRVVGITLGCLLGMLPLLFITEDPKAQAEKSKS